MTSTIEQAEELLAKINPNYLRLDADFTECCEVLETLQAVVDELKESKRVNMDHALSLEIIGGTAESNLALKQQRDELREALLEAVDAISDWGSYASPYFQEKHGLADDIARYKALANTETSE